MTHTALPEVLQGAAFVSTKGLVYRLFDDDESGHLAAFCPQEETLADIPSPAIDVMTNVSLTAFDELLSEPKAVPLKENARAAAEPVFRTVPALQLFEAIESGECLLPTEDEAEPIIIPFVKPETNVFASLLPTSVAVPEVPLTWAWSEKLNSLNEAAANQIQSLADHLVIQIQQGCRTLFFTGFLKGDGCTTLLLCAARELTNRGYRILLGDANRQHLELRQLLNVPENTVQYDAAMPLSETLSLAVWQNSAAFSQMLLTQKDNYDLVLLDGGSLTAYPLSEHAVFWSDASSDGSVVVINTKQTPESSIALITKRFRERRLPLLGIAENCV
ncbi:MAG: hypothetical protein LBT89_08865 [Planctomycetaceae bacterium]|jgi:hypothetical protein|nr:hypothetical protein [Planctomycetaceae bacterium]